MPAHKIKMMEVSEIIGGLLVFVAYFIVWLLTAISEGENALIWLGVSNFWHILGACLLTVMAGSYLLVRNHIPDVR